jgi:putative SOS response-associated peptidase YedK
MTDEARKAGQDIVDRLRTSSKEALEESNARERQKVQSQHAIFQSAFREGRCCVCDDGLGEFNPSRPCMHWLLRPV